MMEMVNSWTLTVFLVLVLSLRLSKGQTQTECGTHRCDECIAESPDNIWCSEESTTDSRCLQRANSFNCIPGEVIDPMSSVKVMQNDNLSETVQVTPQVVQVKIRPGASVKFNVAVKPYQNYPLDLYILMDASGSFMDDLHTLQAIGSDIVATLANLTKDFAIGFGTFVDKPVVPFVPAVQVRKSDGSCKASLLACAPPHSYNHILSMTNISSKVQSILNEVQISVSVDSPEGGFDALVQAMACPEIIGWRNNSIHMLLFFSDDEYHSAGDGKLGMAILPNDGKCHMEKSQLGDFYEYSGATDYDYPSVNQVRLLVIETSTLLVFAVTDNIRAVYEALQKQIGVGIVKTINSDSSNVLEVISEAYLRGREEILLQYSAPSQLYEISVLPVKNCDIPMENGCDGVALGSEVVFEVSIGLKGCLKNTEELALSIPPLGQQVKVLVNSICQCECPTFEDSELCSSNGDWICGQCVCHDGWFGCYCDCDEVPICLTNPLTNEMCSNRGRCCQGECKCMEGFVGNACECLDMHCKRTDKEYVCSGNGNCDCGGCECSPLFIGTYCQCHELPCVQDGLLCSGVGVCKCTGSQCRCSCDCPFFTTSEFCEEQGMEQQVDLCEEYSECVSCLRDSKSCADICPTDLDYTYEFIDAVYDDVYEINGSPAELCWKKAVYCTYFYYIAFENEESLLIHIESTLCPGNLSSWVVPVLVTGLLILTCLFLILLVKITLDCAGKKTRHKKGRPLKMLINKIPGNEGMNEFALNEFIFTDAQRDFYKLKYSDVLVKYSDLEIQQNSIGEGAFGVVYKANLKTSKKTIIEVAVKTIKYCTNREGKAFLEETFMMKNFSHPFVVGLLGVCFDSEDGFPYIIMPFMCNGNLRDFLKQKRIRVADISTAPSDLPLPVMVEMCINIAEGMRYLAANKFVHRDLAARNCLVDNGLEVKVGDFGLTRDIYSDDYYRAQINAKIPVKWMPPETLHDGLSNEKTDVWSFGVTCWEVFSLGSAPYPGISNSQILEYLTVNRQRLKKPKLCPEIMFSVMERCWNILPEERPTFGTLVILLKDYQDEQTLYI